MGGLFSSIADTIRGPEDVDNLLHKLEDIEHQLTRLASDAKSVREEIEKLRSKKSLDDDQRPQSHQYSRCVTENEINSFEIVQTPGSNKLVAIHFDPNTPIFGNIEECLRKSMATECVSIRSVHLPEGCDRPSSLPLFVLCISVSRLGADISTALQGIKRDHTVAVIVVHNVKAHALSNVSSERILTEDEFKPLGLIVDFAYDSNDGIYACEMNKNSLEKLCQFVKE